MSEMQLRIPPYSEDAEHSVLGAVFLSANSLCLIDDMIEPQDFFRAQNQQIFQAMLDLQADNHPVDVITVSNRLRDTGSEVGMAEIAEIAGSCPSASNVRSYAAVVHSRSVQRKLILAAGEIADIGFSGEGLAQERIDKAQSLLSGIESGGAESSEQINDALREFLTEIEWRSKNEGVMRGLPTGFKELDQRYGGLEVGQLVVLAARPAMGKTTLAMNIAENVALKSSKGVLFFSMEMPRPELIRRLVASQGGLAQRLLQNGGLKDDDWAKLTGGFTRLKDAPIYIDDSPALHINQIRTRARIRARQSGLGLIVVDYLQLATSNGKSREERIGDVSRGLKALAKELEIPIIALSQLNRECDKRVNKRPVLSDLRDSGALEQDADIVSFLYRDEVYNEDSQHKGVAEIITAKQRNGPTGVDYLAARLAISRFDDMTATVAPIKSDSGFEY